jgi:hypothetical protein
MSIEFQGRPSAHKRPFDDQAFPRLRRVRAIRDLRIIEKIFQRG